MFAFTLILEPKAFHSQFTHAWGGLPGKAGFSSGHCPASKLAVELFHVVHETPSSSLPGSIRNTENIQCCPVRW